MNITRVGIDLAKNSFSICAVDERGTIVMERTLRRGELLSCLANIPPSIIAMEAGSGAHHWARELIKLGHDARIIDPRFVAPYRTGGKSSKNDLNDAHAIVEASSRPHMRFVPIKSDEQQAIVLIHRRRSSLVAEHTRTANQIRMKYAQLIPALAWQELDPLYEKLLDLHKQILGYDRKIASMNRENALAKRLMEIKGVGPTTASAILATVGDASLFKNGRQFAAWLGLNKPDTHPNLPAMLFPVNL